MTIANCFKDLLCGLGFGTKNALIALINSYIAQIDVQLAVLQSKLVYLDVATAPLRVINTAATTAIAELKAGANVIPFDLVQTCFEVNALNEAIQVNLDEALTNVNIVVEDLARLLSFRDEIQASLDELNEVRALYTDIIVAFNACD